MSDLLFVEVFAGTARLCKATKEFGIEVLPVDKTSSRASQIYIAQYDVTDPEQLECLMEVLEVEKHRIVALHLAPACGTASKAREKKLVSWAKKGFKIPKPLRSAQKPMGVDGLAGLDKIRTESANQVYSATARIMRFCAQHGILCSVENPENSLYGFFQKYRKSCWTLVVLVFLSITACTAEDVKNSQNGGQLRMFFQNCRVCVMRNINMPNGTRCNTGQPCNFPQRKKPHIHIYCVNELQPSCTSTQFQMAHCMLTH